MPPGAFFTLGLLTWWARAKTDPSVKA